MTKRLEPESAQAGSKSKATEAPAPRAIRCKGCQGTDVTVHRGSILPIGRTKLRTLYEITCRDPACRWHGVVTASNKPDTMENQS